MEYPIFQVPFIGGGLLIAAVAIVHVLIAHFAIGAGLFNAVHEALAYRRSDATMLAFLRRHSRFLILFSFVGGAVTGVGIWFAIALVSPRATSNLIHLFVWGWATEWSFFLIEIVAGYVYLYTWGRVRPAVHNAIGWIYAAAAVATLVVINGIISFMLTPGRFAGPGDYWHNLFNPSFWPSVFVRAISATALAAIFVIIVVNYCRGFSIEQRQHVIRLAARWLTPLALMVPLGFWYFQAAPPEARRYVFGWSAAPMVLMFTFGVLASILIAAYAYFGLLRAGRYVSGETGLLLLGIAVIATGSMEFVREGIRKPYLIHGQLYSTQLTPAELAQTERFGTLEGAKWFVRERDAPDAQRGRAIFMVQCYACHTLDGGYNPVAPLVRNYTDAQYDAVLGNLHASKESMPHYRPTPDDRRALTAFLRTLHPD